MNLSAKYSKTGKGVQETSGKTSHLSRGDRAVLSAIDGKTPLAEVQKQFDKLAGPKFEALIQQLDKDGFIREIAGASGPESISPLRKPATPPPPKAAPPPSADLTDGLDFTHAMKMPSKAPAAPTPPKPPVDLAAASRAEAERKAKETAAVDFRARQDAEAKAAAEAKAKAELEAKARAAAEAKARADAEARGKAEAEAKAKADSEAKARADAEAKSRAARDMALRMAAEAKAKAEAEAKDKARLEAELNAKLEEERRAREEAEKRAAEAADRARKELEEKAKRDAEELRQKLEAEMKAKLEEERRLREEEDRKRREEEDRRRKEEDEKRAKEEAERRAREEEDRKRREEEDRRRKEEDERRAKEEAERRAREEADRKRREEEDRKRREEDERRRKEDQERRAKEESERRAKEDSERKSKQESERKAKEEAERRAREEAERKAQEAPAAAAPAPAPAPAAPAAAGGDFGSLLSDLDSFGQKEEEELKAKAEAERKEKEDAARRAKEEAERRAKEEADRKAKEEADRKAKEEAERRAKEEEERRAKEEEGRRKEEEEERKRKAKEALAAKQADMKAAGAAAAEEKIRKPAPKAKGGDDIGVSDEDLDMDDVRRDEKAISREARQAAKEREQVAVVKAKPPAKWGKPAAIALFVILIVGVGALHVMPLSTAEYEKAAAEALGAPVKVSSARLSVITGVQVNLEGVTVGDAKFRLARGYPEIGSLFGAKKSFSRIELEGASLSQAQLGEALFGKAGSDNFRVGRIVFKQVKLDGPLTLPAVDIEAVVGGDGSLQTVTVSGPDKLSVRLTPRGSEVGFEANAGSLALPFVPAMTLSDFGWKGTATRQGIASSEFDGRQYDGMFSGTARVRWGPTWTVEGEVRTRGARVAVFAPTLVSEGKVEGRGNYTMSGPSPAKLGEGARLEGSFKIENGVIGNFALRRALETGGAQTAGRTEFAELTGQGVYDKGSVQLRNLAVASGAMNAGASLDIDPAGALAGRIAAEVKTPNQTLRAVLNITGSLQNPVIRK